MSTRFSIAARAPVVAAATHYDRDHLSLYAALLDADAVGEPWQDAAEALMGLDPEEPGTEACWRSHLDRAHWIVGDGLASAMTGFEMNADRPLH